MRKTKNKNKSPMRLALIGITVVLLIVAIFLLLSRWEDSFGFFPEHEMGSDVIRYNGKDYVLKDNVETFLVLGLDKFQGTLGDDSYNNDKQADFLMLFVFDNDTKQYTAIHINRDSMVDVNVLGVAGNKINTVFKQIALSHTYGNGKDLSCHNTANSVSSLLKGMKVDHYISLTMDSVTALNDLVGGVEVTVLDDFSGIDDTLVKGEKILLKGEQAITYVRARQGLEDSSNSTRMKRQQQYVTALYEALCDRMETDAQFAVDASVTMSDYMVSDRSVTQLQTLADKFGKYEFLGIENISGESVAGDKFMEFYPNEESIEKIIVKLFYTPKD